METVFDHNLTAEELDLGGYLSDHLTGRHGILFPALITETVYRQFITPQAAALDLYLLFSFRGDEAKAAQYAAQIPDLVAPYEQPDYLVNPV